MENENFQKIYLKRITSIDYHIFHIRRRRSFVSLSRFTLRTFNEEVEEEYIKRDRIEKESFHVHGLLKPPRQKLRHPWMSEV